MRRVYRLRRAATWWFIGGALHVLWIVLLIVWLSNPSLEEPLIDLVGRYRSPNAGGPDYLIAYGYIIDGLVTILMMGVASLTIAAVLQIRENRIDKRIKRGLCPACAYPIGDSPVCTECGKPVTPR